MKKYIFLLSIVVAGLFTACDYNEKNFPGYEDLSKPVNIAKYDYTILPGDITIIVNALNAKKTPADSAMAKTLNADKMFSDAAPAATLVPYVLTNKFYSADKTSSANVTYQYKEGRSATLTKLSQPIYTLTTNDYKLVWGTNYVEALTPAKAPNTEIPKVLAADFPNAVEGDYKSVEYNYSTEEPTVSQVEVKYLSADFEGIASGTGVATALDGWINKDLKGSIFWQTRAFSGNQYSQVSANNSKTENEVWLISSAVDLKQAISPKFSFFVTAGYYNAACLSIMVSENFNGTETGIKTATWTDITNKFTLPTGPASGYGTLASAGEMDFKAYAGKKVYVAFKYVGNGIDNSASTTFQIDNVKISEVKSAMSVKSTVKQDAVYQFTSGKWAPAPSSIIIIQPSDYTTMGVTYLGTTTAVNYIPQYLSQKLPYAQEGAVYSVVYKSGSGNAYYADEYTFTGGNWKVNSFVETLTSQFVVSNTGWVFDPTLYVTMQKGKNPTDDYMMMVLYVKTQPYYTANPALVSSYGDSEYYYGFSGNYGNISLRESDRIKDTTFPSSGSAAEKSAFFTQRTQEGLGIYLSLKFPTATPQVSGIDVYAFVTTNIYDGATTVTKVFKYQCIGDKKWKYISDEAK